MTPKMLLECCRQNQGWSQPELNDCLVLHYKGFRKIENLKPYVNVKTIWLQCNGFLKIEGLDELPGLISLYLQHNCIRRIENLDGLKSLQTLDISHNSITEVEGLAKLHSLETIKLAANKITEVSSLQGLLERPSLRSVDVSQNYIEDGPAFLDFWEKSLLDVECLYLHHNPCSRALKDYRRRMISSHNSLRWIDDRPVSELERVGAEAWGAGGKEAEKEAQRNHILAEREEKARSFQAYQRLGQAAAARINAEREAKAAQTPGEKDAAAEAADPGSPSQDWVTAPSRPSGSSTLQLEPTKQAVLNAKVQAFLKSRRPAPEPPSAEAPSPLTEETQSAEPVFSTEAAAESELEGKTVESSSSSSVQVFEWTSFRDKRLGRLVAECRYDFKKVALRLSEEFSAEIDVESCRQQYRKLIKGSNSDEAKSRDAGRAKDAPDLEPSQVQEVSKWWVQQLSTGQHSKHTSAPSQPPKEARQTVTNVNEGLLDLSGLEEACSSYAPGGDGFHEKSAGSMRLSALSAPSALSTTSELGNLFSNADSTTFQPPPRVAQLEDGGVDVTATLLSGGQKGSAAPKACVGGELFELD